MIWLRLFIAVIALTISSDLSAWGQSQMQVNSPEGFYDCKGVANGTNDRDINQKCCLPSEHTYEPHCGKCFYKKNVCEEDFGCGEPDLVCNKCRYTMTPCESHVQRCGATVVCDKCDYTMTTCETELNQCGAKVDEDNNCCRDDQKKCNRCNGCRSCSLNSHCQNPDGPTDCNPGYSDPHATCPNTYTLSDGQEIWHISHDSHAQVTKYLWSSDISNEQLWCFAHTITRWVCRDGEMAQK